VTSILFPIFASYKALRSSDPAQLAPWLMYWTTLSLALAAESFLYPILSWVPFYSWIRLGAHLYLVLPGQQGSVFVYQNYIHPFLYEHEREIDRFITSSHDKAKAAGLQYLKQGIEWVKVNLLGMQPRRPTPPASRNVSYSQSLLNRFVMPSARPEGYSGAASSGAGANDLFSMLGNVMAQAAGPSGAPRSRDAQAKDLSASGNLVPPHMSGDERNAYISTQQDHLRTLLEAFNKEASREHTPASSPPYPTNDGPGPNFQDFLRPAAEGLLNRSKSESEFEDLGYEHVSTGSNKPSPRLPERSGSWSKWVWGNYGEKDSAAGQKKND
jgi:receptor expression-enhancing protein 1/2/3/4